MHPPEPMSGRLPINGSKPQKSAHTAAKGVLNAAPQLMRRCNGCKFFAPNAARTEPDRCGIVVEAVIDMVTVGRAKSAVGQYRSMASVRVVNAWQGGFRNAYLGV